MGKTIKITLNDKAAKDLKALQKKLKMEGMAETIHCSLSLTRFLVLQKEKGNEIIIREVGTNKKRMLGYLC